MKRLGTAAWIFLLGMGGTGYPQEPPASKPWKWELGSGLSMDRGNTDRDGYNAFTNLEYATPIREVLLKANGAYAETSRVKDANRGELTLNYNQNFWRREGFFLSVMPSYNEFQRVDLRLQNGAGLEHSFVKNDTARCSLSAGILYELEQIGNASTGGVDRRDLTRFSLRPKAKYSMNATNSVSAVYSYQPRVDRFNDYRMALEAVLEINIYKNLYFDARVKDEYNEIVPDGIKRNDLSFLNSIKLKL